MSTDKAGGWVGIAFAVWSALLIFAAILAIVPGWPAVAIWLSKDAAPAWVQAVGSILAILAAVAVAYYQDARQRKVVADAQERRRKELVQLTCMAIGLVGGVANIIETKSKALAEDDDPNTIFAEFIEHELQLLRNAPLWEMDPHTVRLISRIVRSAGLVHLAIRTRQEWGTGLGAKRLFELCNRTVVELGGEPREWKDDTGVTQE